MPSVYLDYYVHLSNLTRYFVSMWTITFIFQPLDKRSHSPLNCASQMKSNTLWRDTDIQTHVAAVSTMLKFSLEASEIFCDMILMSMLPNLLMGMMSHLQAKEGQTQGQK
jgi:hypothetical protein